MSPPTFSRLSYLINSIEQLKKPPLESIGKHLGRISGQHISYKSNKALLISQIVNAFQYVHRNHKSVFDRVYNCIRRGLDLGYTGTDFQSANYYNTELNDILAIVHSPNPNNSQSMANQAPIYSNGRAASAYSSTINNGRSNPAYENYFNNINIERLVGFNAPKHQTEKNHSLPSIDTILPNIHYDRNKNLGTQKANNSIKSGPPAPFEGRFAPSPFYKIIKAISPAKCIHASGSKSTVSLAFSLGPEDYNRIKSKSKLTHYDRWIGLRLLCGRQNLKDANGYDMVEFPMVCEVRVNSIVQKGNLKGIKNKPGTTAPPDITVNCKIIPNVHNRIDITYVNTSIDYFMSVQLVEELSVDSLAYDIKQQKFVSSSQVQKDMFKSQNEDDIVTLQSSLTLKDPLTLTRISSPLRSTTCNHVQCFDASSFLSMNSQTPTWDCPVCQKHIGGVHNLIYDGYFLEILNDPRTQNLDYVLLNPDGSWKSPSETTAKPKAKSLKTQADSVAIALDLSDSEEEDYERVHKAPSNNMHISQPSPISNVVSGPEVIDLTFSD